MFSDAEGASVVIGKGSYERQRRRLRRENHLLRLQVLKMQKERRQRSGTVEGAPARNIVNRVEVPSSSTSAESAALQLRIQSLQRQNEREKARRAAGEKQLRYEIELLRLALDEATAHPHLAQKSTEEDAFSDGSSVGEKAATSSTSTDDLYAIEMKRAQEKYNMALQQHYNERGENGLDSNVSESRSGSYQLPKDDLLARTASRRELRRQRLEKIEHATSSISDDLLQGESTTAEPSTSHVPAFTNPSPHHTRYPRSGPVMPLQGHHGGPTVDPILDLEEEEDSDPFATTAKNHLISEMPVFNPNQIGVEIKEDEKNRTWYTKQMLAMAFLEFFPPARRTTAVIKQKEVKETNVLVTAMDKEGSAPGSASQSSDRKRRTLLGDKEYDSSVLSASEESDSETTRKTNSSEVVHVDSTLEESPNPGRAMMYRDQNPIALQRAIQESFSLHSRCKGNEPCLQPWRTAESTVFPPFESENSDLNLIHSFCDPEGNEHRKKSKKHKSKKTEFRDDEVRVVLHAPVVFSQIRDFLNMDVDNFRLSMEKSVWRQSMSPGKSGTTLYYFGNYVMKTVHESEFQFFITRYLPAYVQYCERNPHTLLPRFYAVLTLKWLKLNVTKRFVLMHNVFATHYYIHRIYDVKGSTVGRTALQPGKPPPRTAFGALLLKDNDLPSQLIICGAYQRAILLAQFRSDVNFLNALNIVDYSCMIGVRSRVFSTEEGPSRTIFLRKKKSNNSEYSNFNNVVEEHATTLSNLEGKDALQVGGLEDTEDGYICIHGCDGGLLSLPIYAPGDDTTAREDVYYLGIIDVLQEYNSVKKLENFAKGFVNDKHQISVIPPSEYAERLYKRLESITV